MKKTKSITQKTIIDQLVQKTYRELAQSQKPQAKSRVWKTSQGYKFLIPWSNAALLRILIRKVSSVLPRSEYRAKAQVDDAARSVLANIEEGWKRPTTSEYLQFLGYSQGSLEEVKGDVERFLQDEFLKSVPKSGLKDLGIDLGDWGLWIRDPLNSPKILSFPLKKNGAPRTDVRGTSHCPGGANIPYQKTNSSTGLHPWSSWYWDKGGGRNLKEIKGKDISYQQLIELINKTDWHLKRLVQSLEKKLNQDQKAYQTERARIKNKIR
ncbi:four helix bundle protein [Patescibacteria group bacterium]|nr:four helix bundle protein [Patescibacteria group bacterium]